MAIKVLVATNDFLLRERLRKLLANSNVQLLLAADVSLALYLMHKNLPDLLLVDDRLADQGLATLLDQLNNDPHLCGAPAVVLTEQPSPDLTVKNLRSVSILAPDKEILAVIKPLLQERKVARALETPE